MKPNPFGVTSRSLSSPAVGYPADSVRHLVRSRSGRDRQRWTKFGAALVLVVLMTLLYLKIMVKLVTDWYLLPDFSHGFLIPFFVVFLVWDSRDAIRDTPVTQSWSGLWLVVLALFLLLTGVFGADLFLSRLSFVLLVAGLVWTLCGRAMLRRTKFSSAYCFWRFLCRP
jgi:hypothetical protein